MTTTTPADNPRAAVAYVRVSTDEQHLGPEAQRAAVEAWAAREGVAVLGWFTDHGVSGAAPLDKRPGLAAALDAAAAHGADLVVAKRDRVARDTMLAAMVERMVERAGGRVVSADGVGNGDTPEAALMRAMVAAFAEYERALIAARTRAALAAKRAKGERVGSVPYGSKLAADGCTLAPVEGERAAIDAARELRASGLSLRAVADALAARGMVSRNGRPFHAQQIARLLKRAG